jgi:HD-GYP domain-containing protein (c-di-GMP phosphodiesterase class II)
MRSSQGSRNTRIRIEKGDIQVGEALQCNVYDDRKRLLLRQGNVLTSQGQIDLLTRRGVFFITNEEDASRTGRHEPRRGLSPFELIDDAYLLLESLFRLREEKTRSRLHANIGRICGMIQAACEQDEGAVLSTILLQNEGKYSIRHQIHTTIACEAVLKSMGYKLLERLPILAASLTMNISINFLQDALFHQKERLSEDQEKRIKSHLFEGVEILHQSGVTDQVWLDTVLQHHELLDGRGYPRQLQGSAILEPARVLTIADIFCAKVTGRAYRKPISPNVALKEIYCKERGHSIDVGLSHRFIKQLGIYPPGSLVRLANGDIAVVIRAGEKADSPIAASIMRSNEKTYLNPRRRNTIEKEFAVMEILAPSDFRVLINRDQIWCDAG